MTCNIITYVCNLFQFIIEIALDYMHPHPNYIYIYIPLTFCFYTEPTGTLVVDTLVVDKYPYFAQFVLWQHP